MAKIDKIKTTLDFLKGILLALLLSFFGIISFLVVNGEKLPLWKVCVGIVGLVINLLCLGILSYITVKKINELENL